MEENKKPLSHRFYEDCDKMKLAFTQILYWNDGTLFDREEVEILFAGGYIYRTVYETTLAEIQRINDMYDSR